MSKEYDLNEARARVLHEDNKVFVIDSALLFANNPTLTPSAELEALFAKINASSTTDVLVFIVENDAQKQLISEALKAREVNFCPDLFITNEMAARYAVAQQTPSLPASYTVQNHALQISLALHQLDITQQQADKPIDFGIRYFSSDISKCQTATGMLITGIGANLSDIIHHLGDDVDHRAVIQAAVVAAAPVSAAASSSGAPASSPLPPSASPLVPVGTDAPTSIVPATALAAAVTPTSNDLLLFAAPRGSHPQAPSSPFVQAAAGTSGTVDARTPFDAPSDTSPFAVPFVQVAAETYNPFDVLPQALSASGSSLSAPAASSPFAPASIALDDDGAVEILDRAQTAIDQLRGHEVVNPAPDFISLIAAASYFQTSGNISQWLYAKVQLVKLYQLTNAERSMAAQLKEILDFLNQDNSLETVRTVEEGDLGPVISTLVDMNNFLSSRNSLTLLGKEVIILCSKILHIKSQDITFNPQKGLDSSAFDQLNRLLISAYNGFMRVDSLPNALLCAARLGTIEVQLHNYLTDQATFDSENHRYFIEWMAHLGIVLRGIKSAGLGSNGTIANFLQLARIRIMAELSRRPLPDYFKVGLQRYLTVREFDLPCDTDDDFSSQATHLLKEIIQTQMSAQVAQQVGSPSSLSSATAAAASPSPLSLFPTSAPSETAPVSDADLEAQYNVLVERYQALCQQQKLNQNDAEQLVSLLNALISATAPSHNIILELRAAVLLGNLYVLIYRNDREDLQKRRDGLISELGWINREINASDSRFLNALHDLPHLNDLLKIVQEVTMFLRNCRRYYIAPRTEQSLLDATNVSLKCLAKIVLDECNYNDFEGSATEGQIAVLAGSLNGAREIYFDLDLPIMAAACIAPLGNIRARNFAFLHDQTSLERAFRELGAIVEAVIRAPQGSPSDYQELQKVLAELITFVREQCTAQPQSEFLSVAIKAFMTAANITAKGNLGNQISQVMLAVADLEQVVARKAVPHQPAIRTAKGAAEAAVLSRVASPVSLTASPARAVQFDPLPDFNALRERISAYGGKSKDGEFGEIINEASQLEARLKASGDTLTLLHFYKLMGDLHFKRYEIDRDKNKSNLYFCLGYAEKIIEILSPIVTASVPTPLSVNHSNSEIEAVEQEIDAFIRAIDGFIKEANRAETLTMDFMKHVSNRWKTFANKSDQKVATADLSACIDKLIDAHDARHQWIVSSSPAPSPIPTVVAPAKPSAKKPAAAPLGAQLFVAAAVSPATTTASVVASVTVLESQLADLLRADQLDYVAVLLLRMQVSNHYLKLFKYAKAQRTAGAPIDKTGLYISFSHLFAVMVLLTEMKGKYELIAHVDKESLSQLQNELKGFLFGEGRQGPWFNQEISNIKNADNLPQQFKDALNQGYLNQQSNQEALSDAKALQQTLMGELLRNQESLLPQPPRFFSGWFGSGSKTSKPTPPAKAAAKAAGTPTALSSSASASASKPQRRDITSASAAPLKAAAQVKPGAIAQQLPLVDLGGELSGFEGFRSAPQLASGSMTSFLDAPLPPSALGQPLVLSQQPPSGTGLSQLDDDVVGWGAPLDVVLTTTTAASSVSTSASLFSSTLPSSPGSAQPAPMPALSSSAPQPLSPAAPAMGGSSSSSSSSSAGVVVSAASSASMSALSSTSSGSSSSGSTVVGPSSAAGSSTSTGSLLSTTSSAPMPALSSSAPQPLSPAAPAMGGSSSSSSSSSAGVVVSSAPSALMPASSSTSSSSSSSGSTVVAQSLAAGSSALSATVVAAHPLGLRSSADSGSGSGSESGSRSGSPSPRVSEDRSSQSSSSGSGFGPGSRDNLTGSSSTSSAPSSSLAATSALSQSSSAGSSFSSAPPAGTAPATSSVAAASSSRGATRELMPFAGSNTKPDGVDALESQLSGAIPRIDKLELHFQIGQIYLAAFKANKSNRSNLYACFMHLIAIATLLQEVMKYPKSVEGVDQARLDTLKTNLFAFMQHAGSAGAYFNHEVAQKQKMIDQSFKDVLFTIHNLPGSPVEYTDATAQRDASAMARTLLELIAKKDKWFPKPGFFSSWFSSGKSASAASPTLVSSPSGAARGSMLLTSHLAQSPSHASSPASTAATSSAPSSSLSSSFLSSPSSAPAPTAATSSASSSSLSSSLLLSASPAPAPTAATSSASPLSLSSSFSSPAAAKPAPQLRDEGLIRDELEELNRQLLGYRQSSSVDHIQEINLRIQIGNRCLELFRHAKQRADISRVAPDKTELYNSFAQLIKVVRLMREFQQFEPALKKSKESDIQQLKPAITGFINAARSVGAWFDQELRNALKPSSAGGKGFSDAFLMFLRSEFAHSPQMLPAEQAKIAAQDFLNNEFLELSKNLQTWPQKPGVLNRFGW